jgi:hypothetical protein
MAKNKTNSFIKITVALVMLFNIIAAQTKNTDVLDLFNGVVNVDASTGNINPPFPCTGSGYGSYNQKPTTPTLNDIIVSTPLNTNYQYANYSSFLSPVPTRPLGSMCIQYLPNYGSLWSNYHNSILTQDSSNGGHTQFISSTNSFNKSLKYPTSFSEYRPPLNFKGVACFAMYLDISTGLDPYDYTFSNSVIIPGPNYGPSNESTNIADFKIQVGGSTSTTCGPDPVVGQVGSPFPSFYAATNGNVTNVSLNIGSSVIVGSITDNIFTPNPGQIIPLDANIGPSSFFFGDPEALSVSQTNFTSASAQGGGTISINTSNQSSLNSSTSSLFSSSTSSQYSVPGIPQATPTKSLELAFRKYGVTNVSNSGSSTNSVSNSNANNLDITDPYICEQQVITGNVKYTGDFKDLNPVSIKLKNYNANQSSYNSNPVVNPSGDYEVDIKNMAQGNYQVEFSISDKLGNTANGTYSFEKKYVCEQNSPNSKGASINNNLESKAFNLTRTGGLENNFISALLNLLFAMTAISLLGFRKGD